MTKGSKGRWEERQGLTFTTSPFSFLGNSGVEGALFWAAAERKGENMRVSNAQNSANVSTNSGN